MVLCVLNQRLGDTRKEPGTNVEIGVRAVAVHTCNENAPSPLPFLPDRPVVHETLGGLAQSARPANMILDLGGEVKGNRAIDRNYPPHLCAVKRHDE